MGTARSNLLNQLKGSFGNVILYEVNGQLRIRSKTGRYRKSKSSKQKAQKNRFKGAASFYHKLEMPMYMTWSDATHGQNISGYNLFIKENIHSFTETGEITEFSGLKICYGPLYIPDYFGMQYTTPDLIRLEWNPGYKNQGFDDDLLQIAIYDKTRVDDGEIYWLEGFEPYGLQEHIPLLSRPKEVKRSIYLLFSKINTGTFFRKVVFWEQW